MNEICVNPAEIQEGDLMAYVDGLADEAITRHIRRCAACARQAEALASLQAALGARLYRFACSSSEQLLAYREGELTGSEKLVVAQHLRQCPHCARELASLVHQERKSLSEWLRTAVEVMNAAMVTPQLQSAGVRGDSTIARTTLQVYRAGQIEIIMSLQPSRTTSCRWDLSGLVHSGGYIPETIGEAKVELYQHEGLVDITSISSRGQFAFMDVEPGNYNLSLAWGSREIRMQGIRVE